MGGTRQRVNLVSNAEGSAV